MLSIRSDPCEGGASLDRAMQAKLHRSPLSTGRLCDRLGQRGSLTSVALVCLVEKPSAFQQFVQHGFELARLIDRKP